MKNLVFLLLMIFFALFCTKLYGKNVSHYDIAPYEEIREKTITAIG